VQVIPHSLGKSEVLKGGWEVRVRFPGRAVVSFWPNWRNGSAPAYGAGGCGFDPHVGLVGSRSSVGRSSASHAEGPGFDPLRELVISRKVERSIRPENSSCIPLSDMV
jgi:hypothetical protein